MSKTIDERVEGLEHAFARIMEAPANDELDARLGVQSRLIEDLFTLACVLALGLGLVLLVACLLAWKVYG